MNDPKMPRSQSNRREFLKTSAAAAAVLGLRPDYAQALVPNEFDGSKFQLAAPEPNPKRGGVMK